ncbi:MAG: ATP-binding cassette subfamily F protein 3 [Verrucomicrobiales bacterium]|jgi:ATP-binding cassette subfamily F protein 3
MLTIRKLTKAVSTKTLFENADLTVNYGERTALVGPNGAGKTTLFNLILGTDTADSGKIDRDEWTTTGFLPQECDPVKNETALQIAVGQAGQLDELEQLLKSHEDAGTVDNPAYYEAQTKFDALNDPALEAKAKKIMRGLGFREHDWERPANELSGGWVMRAHLARLLALEPELLMLDEPTNHLDLMSLWWFRDHLKNYPGAILMISHDREFMDAVVESVAEIEDQKLNHFTGNYTAYVAEREKRYENRLAAYKNQQKQIGDIQDFIDRFRSVSSKASQVQSRVKQIEKIEKIEKPRQPRKVFKIQFPQPPRSGQRVITLEGVDMAYGDLKIYENLEVEIERNDRIVLVGPNGAGKSTLIKILAGELEIQAGTRKPGHNCRIGYFSQHRSAQLNPNNTVLDEVLEANGAMREDEARGVLGSFLFRKDDVFKRCKILSGGEKSRLNLVKFLVDPPNLLLMDEPTTHLDLISIEALVLALKNYAGTLVFISHDVHFIRSLANNVFHVGGGKVTKFSGGYDYYLEKTNAEENARAALTTGDPLENAQG